MKNSAVVFSIFVAVIIALFLVFSIFGILYFYWGDATAVKDSLSTIGGFFGGFATLGAAIVAAHLFSDWRDEKNYDLENSLLTSILIDLKPLYVELLKVRSDSNNLKRIGTAFIVKTDYLERNRLDLFASTLMLFPNIKTYSSIKNDRTLIDLYDNFDKHCYCFEDFFRILFLERYKRYYEVVIEENQKKTGNPPLKYYNIFKSYSDSRQDSLKIEISEVLKVFEKDALTAEIGEVSKRTTYEHWLQETIDLHDQIQDYCIKGLKVPD